MMVTTTFDFTGYRIREYKGLVRGIIEAIRDINQRGISVLLIEQNVHIALPVSHRGYVLEEGRVALEDAGPALLDNPHVRVSYLGA